MATEDQIVQRALDILTGIGSGQTPNPEDFAKVKAQFNAALSYINEHRFVYYADAQSVPDGSIEPVAVVLAASRDLREHFNADIGDDDRAAAMADLRRMTASEPSYQTLKAMYF